jgi:hypothetical protein
MSVTFTKTEEIIENIEKEIEEKEIVEEILEIDEIIEPERQKEYTLTEAIQDATEHILRYVIFWESDDKKIGIIIQMMHHAFIYGIALWYFYVHTFSTSYVQLVLLTLCWFLIWIQHLCCGACLLFNIECKLIGDHPSIIDNVLHLFNISESNDVKNGILFMISSLIMCMLSFEALSRTIIGIKDWF